MAKKPGLLNRVKLVYKRSSVLTRTVVICAILLSTVTVLTLHHQLTAAEQQRDELKDQAAAVEQENDRLTEYIEQLGTIDSVKRIAQELLGLVEPFFTIFQPQN